MYKDIYMYMQPYLNKKTKVMKEHNNIYMINKHEDNIQTVCSAKLWT